MPDYGRCVIHDSDGNPIARSRNLRGILDRARKLQAMGATKLYAKRLHGLSGNEGTLIARFPDGSWCITGFVSFGVLEHWINLRIIHGRGKFIKCT